MIRKRNDTVKSGRGIDGDLGENYTKQHRVSPWSPPLIGGEDINPKGHGKYTSDESGLRNKPASAGTGGDGAGLWGTHSVEDVVNENSSDDGNRALKSRGQP
jgi:hypothetical protein